MGQTCLHNALISYYYFMYARSHADRSYPSCAGHHCLFLRLFNCGCVSNYHYVNDRAFLEAKRNRYRNCSDCFKSCIDSAADCNRAYRKSGGIAHIFIFDFGIAVIGTAAAAFLYYRYKKLTGAQA